MHLTWGCSLRFVLRLLALFLLAAALMGAVAAWWLHAPMELRPAEGSQMVDLLIEPGTSPRGVAQAVADAGPQVSPALLFAYPTVRSLAEQLDKLLDQALAAAEEVTS